jgi:Protein of unknown function (DUF3822)
LLPQTKIVEPSFNIRTDNANALQKHLFAEAGPQGLSLICADTATNTITDCVVYHFAAGINTAGLREQLTSIFAEEPLLAQSYKKIDLVYAFNEAILTPHEVYNAVTNAAMLSDIFGDAPETVVKTDFIYRQNIHNVYRVPAAINAAVNAATPSANYTHQYSLLADAFMAEGNTLHVVFYTHSLTVLLRKQGNLQLVRHFEYSTPETAAWYLLNVCSCFGLTANEVSLVLHGMIDGKSALYAELYKYFLQIDFATLPQGLKYSIDTAAVPHHYFSHLFAMLLCV